MESEQEVLPSILRKRGGVMARSPYARCIAFAGAILAFLALFTSCNKKENTAPKTETAAPAESAAASSADAMVPTEEVSDAAAGGSAQTLVLPLTFQRRTADLDVMLKERNIRALVLINPISFFYDKGQPHGITYEALRELESYINKKYKTGALKVQIAFIPMRPDQLAAALDSGVGDIIAFGTQITPEREQKYAFSTPLLDNVSEIVVTGPGKADAKSWDDLVGTEIYVNPLTVHYTRLMQINDERKKAGKPALSIKAGDKSLMEDDFVEMVNAGLLPATVTSDQRAKLWADVLPNVKPHPDIVVSSGGKLAWVMRKDNPQLVALVNEFVADHREGTSFGNTLIRRYLQNKKWVTNSTSAEEMKKFATYVEYFKKYSGQYNFDYLMIAAQGYQESLLDQSKRNRSGAVGIMQVIPKNAAAAPINVPNVSTADQNILAGVRMLNNIQETYFNDPAINQVNRTLFTFAAYNAGPNRIARLRKKAADQGLDPNKWFGNVELVVAQDVGQETVGYVGNIYKYYVAYKLGLEQKQSKEKAKAAGSN
jgi:membrane-bound lytic murein transglycosylase MltF